MVSADNIPETIAFTSERVSLWGVPGDQRHDRARGWQCLDEEFWKFSTNEPCTGLKETQPAPFITLPTSCTGPLQTTVEGDSWPSTSNPGGLVLPPAKPASTVGLDGCDHLGFKPEVKVAPDGEAGSTPTGLTVDIHVPQDESSCANRVGGVPT